MSSPELVCSSTLEMPSRRCSSEKKVSSARSSTLSTEEAVETLTQSDPEMASETSWKALSQILVAFFLAFNTWGVVNSFGVYQEYYSATNVSGRTNSEISWIGSLQAFLTLMTLVFTGPIFDRGQSRMLVFLGMVLVVVGMMMTSLATEYWQLVLAQGLTVGLGHGALFICCIGQLALTFKKMRWMAMGLAQSGGSIGAIIFSEIFRQLQPSIGAAWATRTIAFIMLGTLCISLTLLHPHQLPRPRKMFDADVFRNGPFNVFAIASFTGFLGLYIPFFYIQEYALAHSPNTEHNANLAYATIAILNAGSVVGRVVPGFVADRCGLMNSYTAFTIGATILALVWIACRDFVGIVLFAIFYGIFSGCTAALQPAVLASLAPSPNLVGTWVGLGSIFSSIGLLLGNPLGGLVLDHKGWLALQLYCACLVLACTLATAATRVLRSGTDFRVKI